MHVSIQYAVNLTKRFCLLFFLISFWILTGCASASDNATTPDENNNNASAYPVNNTQPSISGNYPAPQAVPTAINTGYPGPTPVPTIATDGVRFLINGPLTPETRIVSGTAPPNRVLAIVDITYAGTILGTGRSDAEGDFSIPVSELLEGHRIGIAVAELNAGETVTSMIKTLYPYRGDNYQNVPNIGVFFDTILVEP